MIKEGTTGIPCTYCDNIALAGTNPPVCEAHAHTKTASADVEVETLKELNQKED